MDLARVGKHHMTAGMPQGSIKAIQKHTNAPWWNGAAYAEYMGYPQRIGSLERGLSYAIDDLHDLMSWLREEGQYEKADRLRTILGGMARSLNARDNEPTWRTIAKGYK